jgi:hypothetical protein
LGGAQRREEEMASCPVGSGDAVAGVVCLTDHRVDRRPFGVGRRGVEEVQIH